MGKRRDKFFISKNEKTTTYKLTPAVSAEAPSQIENPEVTNVVEVTEQELKDRETYGIFYSDDYNYMSHLKSKDEESIDPAVLEALNMNEEGFGDLSDESDDEGIYNRLEDNFLELAGGVDISENNRIYEEIRKTALTLDSEADESDDDVDDDGELKGIKIVDQDEAEEDEEAEAESDEEEDDEQEGQVDAQLLNSLADEYMAKKEQLKSEKPDDTSKQLSLAAFERQEATNDETSERIEVEVRSKKPRWDCESICSTYSTLYNHPTIIGESIKRKSPGRSKRDIKQLNAESKMDADDIASIRSAPKTNTTRVRGETTEERRERKQTVKEERRERRQERKSNKTAFKDEKKRLDAQRSRVVVDGRPLR